MNKKYFLFAFSTIITVQAAQQAPQKLAIPYKAQHFDPKILAQRELIRSKLSADYKKYLDDGLADAARYGDRSDIRDFLDLAADPNEPDSKNERLIGSAAKKGNNALGCINDLLAAGALVDQHTLKSLDYMLSIQSDNFEIYERLQAAYDQQNTKKAPSRKKRTHNETNIQ